MESVLGVQSQTRDLGAQLVLGDRSSFVAVAVQAEATQLCCRKLDGIPFQHYACLGCVSASEHRSGRRVGAEGVVDVGLQGRELLIGNGFGVLVAGDVDVDDAAGVDVGRKED